MTMAMISPSGREVSPAGSSCRSSRLDLVKFRLVAAEKPRKSSTLIFFRTKPFIQQKRGGQWAIWVPTSPVAAAGGGWRLPGLWAPSSSPLALLSPSIFYIFPKNSMLIFRAFGVAQNRELRLAPFPVQNSSCRYSPSSNKPCKIRDKRHKYGTTKYNNSPKSNKYQHEIMMQNERINSPKLRPRLSSSENQDPQHVHRFRDEGVDKT